MSGKKDKKAINLVGGSSKTRKKGKAKAKRRSKPPRTQQKSRVARRRR